MMIVPTVRENTLTPMGRSTMVNLKMPHQMETAYYTGTKSHKEEMRKFSFYHP